MFWYGDVRALAMIRGLIQGSQMSSWLGQGLGENYKFLIGCTKGPQGP